MSESLHLVMKGHSLAQLMLSVAHTTTRPSPPRCSTKLEATRQPRKPTTTQLLSRKWSLERSTMESPRLHLSPPTSSLKSRLPPSDSIRFFGEIKRPCSSSKVPLSYRL